MPWEVCPDVELAPSGATPLAWRTCGPGCRELAVDGARRFFGAVGGRAQDGRPWLGLVRDHGAVHELVLYRLPDAAPVFAARMTRGFAGCLVRLRAIGPDGGLVETSLRDAGGRRRLISVEPRGRLVGDERAERPPLETAFDGRRVQTTTRTSIEIDGATVWRAAAGELVSELVAHHGAVAFTSVTDGRSMLKLWRGRSGPPVVIASHAGAPVSDGRDLVYFAGGALIATRWSTFAPRRLRAAHQDYVDAGRGAVGDGFALHVERRRAEPEATLILTRLADGRAWTIPRRPDARWGSPLWVDGDELAVVLEPDAATVRAGTIESGESLSVVRLAHPVAP